MKEKRGNAKVTISKKKLRNYLEQLRVATRALDELRATAQELEELLRDGMPSQPVQITRTTERSYPERTQELFADDTYTNAEVAEEVGMSVKWVGDHRSKYRTAQGLPPLQRGPKPAAHQRLSPEFQAELDMIENGPTPRFDWDAIMRAGGHK